MIDLVDEPWPTLERLCIEHAAKRLDIMTGFLGSGATLALEALGVRARIVIGLPSADAVLSAGQVAEVRSLIAAQHEVRWSRGLHAKLYLVDGRAMLVGSANFTTAGFEKLDEICIATDTPSVVSRAVEMFQARFANASAIEPDRLRIADAGTDGDGLGSSLGTAWSERTSGFSVGMRPADEAVASSVDANDNSAATSIDDSGVVVNFDGDEFMYMNIAEGPHRCWVDCRRYGFLSAGQGERWSSQLVRLNVGAPVYAYFKEHGYVGLGVVDGERRMASEHVVNGTRLFDLPLVQPGIKENSANPSKCEWVVPIRWYRTRNVSEAVGYGLFSSQHVTCRLRDPETLKALRGEFERT
jgi:hypothetical protein